MSTETEISRRTLVKAIAASSAAVSASPWFNAELAGAQVMPANSWKQVHPGVWRATIGTPERNSPVSSRLVPPQSDAFAKLPTVDAAPLRTIEGKRTRRGFLVQLPLAGNEQIYGFGLQLLSFAQRGKKKTARVNADPKNDTGDSHAPVPFYVTTEGYGVLIDTARYASFYFGDAHPKPTHPLAAVSDTNLAPLYSGNSRQAKSGFIYVDVPDAGGVDIYLFGGPDMRSAVQRYKDRKSVV